MSAADEQAKARDDYRNGAAQRDPQADREARAGGAESAGSERG